MLIDMEGFFLAYDWETGDFLAFPEALGSIRRGVGLMGHTFNVLRRFTEYRWFHGKGLSNSTQLFPVKFAWNVSIERSRNSVKLRLKSVTW